jgi:hypothetical protein
VSGTDSPLPSQHQRHRQQQRTARVRQLQCVLKAERHRGGLNKTEHGADEDERNEKHDGSAHIISNMAVYNTVQASTMIVKGPLYLPINEACRRDGEDSACDGAEEARLTQDGQKPRDFNSRGSHASTPLRSEKIFVLTMTWPRSTC